VTANTNLGKPVSLLPPVSNIAVTDSLVALSNATGNQAVSLISFGILGANLVLAQSTPSHSNTPGLQGTVSYDSSYFYVCTANGWLRAALGSF
jgi:hypothetical protein